MLKIFAFFLLFFFLLIPTKVIAADIPSISVINPIRGSQLGLENVDLLSSLKGQFLITQKYNVHATWLWQYSALEDESRVAFAKSSMKDHEMGIFLEIDRNFAQKSGILYRGQGPWYFSDGLFLFSYDQTERKKYIDTVFAKFHDTFGYYPKSVGAWWIDAWSLSYMHERYGVTSSLRAADQLDLDVYSIWGTPWSVPYIASETNAAIPAENVEKSSGVLILQWASRDPVSGYSSSASASLYSLQDYFHFKDVGYFSDLLNTYLHSQARHAVIGLESGFAPAEYEGKYETHLKIIDEMRKNRKVRIVKVEDFVKEYRDNEYEDGVFLLHEDTSTKDQAFWYQSSRYRIGIKKSGNELAVVDLRDYARMSTEEYYYLPNTQGYLRVDEPSVIDSSRFPKTKKVILSNVQKIRVEEGNDGVTLFSEDVKIATFSTNAFTFFTDKKIDQLGNTFEHEIISSGWIILWLGSSSFYILFMTYSLRKNKKKRYTTLSLLATLLISAYYMQFLLRNITIFIFDVKMLIFSPFVFLPFSLPVNIIVGFFILPFISMFVLHYFLMIKKEGWANHLFILLAVIFFFVYFKLPYFPLTKSTALIAGVCIFVIAVSKFVYFFKKKKGIRNMKFEILLIGLGAVFLGICVVLSRQQYLLNQFEIRAIQQAASQKHSIIFLGSSSNPIYKASSPLLWKYPFVGQFLTKKKWEYRKDLLSSSDGDLQELVFVPRYLGASIEEKDLQEHSFRSVFDNSSIVLYKK